MRGETGRAGKRPLRSLTAIEKISAIRRVHEGESKASVARDLSVPESTLRGWCKSEHKIRSMARNSSTPDSNEAHSPLSSSGIINNNNNNNNLLINTSLHGNHSSEDEGQSSKRLKIDTSSSIHSTTTGYYTNENLENELTRLSDPSKIDYLSLMTSMAAMRPENNALLLQHLGLLGGNNVGPLAKSLLNLPTAMPHSSTVGLVENGLQYTKSNVNININNNHINNTNNNHHINSSNNNINNNKRHSTSAITPTQSYTRKSSPPAAEIPLTPDPASPRKTSDLLTHHNHLQNNNIHSYNSNNNNNNNSMNYLYNNNNNNNNSISSQNYYQQNNQHRDVKKNNSNAQIPSLNNNKKIDEALWLWLSSQKGAANFNQQDGVYASWFWQWYKQGQGSTMSVDQQQQQQQSQQAQQSQQQLMNGKKSPSKTRALLDSVLCNNNNSNNNNNNNNNDSVKKLMNGVFDVFIDDSQVTNDAGIGAPQTAALPLTATSSSSSSSVQSTTTTTTTTASVISREEAIEHGEKFFKWLNKCSDPAVTRLQIIQVKYLLDNLTTGKKKQSTHLKQRRK